MYRGLLLALAVLAGGCATSAPGVPDTAFEDVRTMLRARAQLLVEGDSDGYLAAAVEGARPVEEAIARGAATVPLAFVNVTVTGKGVAERDATEFRGAEVEVVYGYKEFPKDNRFRFSLVYDLEQRADAWRITRSDPAPPNLGGAGGEPVLVPALLPVWARFTVQATRSDHFLVLHPPGLAGAEKVTALAEQARARLAPRLRFGNADNSSLIIVARDTAEYTELLGRDQPEEALAVVSLLFVPLSPPEGRQMTVNLERVLETGERPAGHAGELTPVSIFQHELAHLALARVGSPVTPSWVEEGAAMYLAGERRLDAWRDGIEEGWFEEISIAGFAEDESLASGEEYAYTNAAVTYLIEEFGTEKFWDFYTRFQPVLGARISDESPAAYLMGSVYDLKLPDLDRRARRWAAEEVD
ncbi:MAG: hypothetical protein ABIW46_01610 [Acidimicrobiales bacterium]